MIQQPLKRFEMTLGATVQEKGTSFKVWAPKCKEIDVVIQNESNEIYPLMKKEDGYFISHIPHLKAGMLYRYRINQDQQYPDPCSCFQPEGPHGPSMIIDSRQYQWHDEDWPGIEDARTSFLRATYWNFYSRRHF
jgi:maltooligosyltrehalose trehalohydrolase